MPNEAEGSLDKRTNSLEFAAQVLPRKLGPYDLTKSEAALTISIILKLIDYKKKKMFNAYKKYVKKALANRN